MKDLNLYLSPVYMKIQLIFLLVLLVCFLPYDLAAQCNPDTESPTAGCLAGVTVSVVPGQNPSQVEVSADDFDGGSFDNCTSPASLDFFIQLSPATASPPATASLTLPPGQFQMVLWVVDEAGNASHCFTWLEVEPDCSNGSTSLFACRAGLAVEVPQQGSVELFPSFFLEGGPYCSDYSLRTFPGGSFAPSIALGTGNLGPTVVEVRDNVTLNSCWSDLLVGSGCANDSTAPSAVCKQDLTVYLDGQTGTATVQAVELNGGSTDDCTQNLQYRIEKNGPSVNPPGTTAVTYGTADGGPQTVTMWALDQAGNAGHCTTILSVDPCTGNPLPVCNAFIEIEVNSPDPVILYPLDVLEGGPYCEAQLQIALWPPVAFYDSLVFDQNSEGTYTGLVNNIVSGLSCFTTIEVTSSCAGETIPPVAVCDQDLTLMLSTDGPDLTILQAAVLDDGSSDNCTPANELLRTVEPGPIPSAVMPMATSLALTDTGHFSVILWVSDASGNTDQCAVEVEVVPPTCNPDSVPPALVAPADTVLTSDAWVDLNLDINNFAQLGQYFGEPYYYDYCGVDTFLQTTSAVFNDCGFLKELTRSFLVIDLAGHTNQAVQKIRVVYDFSIHIPEDFLPGDPGNPVDLTVVQGIGTQLSIQYEEEIFSFNCDTIPDLIHRTWGVINWCDVDINQSPAILPRLDRNADGHPGDAYVMWMRDDSLILLENGLPAGLMGLHDGLVKYTQHIRLNYDDTLTHSITGVVFIDTLSNCSFDTGEPGLSGWKVKVEGQSTGTLYTVLTTANGLYELNGICKEDSVLTVSLDVPFNYGQGCPTTYTLYTVPGMPAVQHIPVQLNGDCPLMYVDLATPFLRRCFQNDYFVNYTNLSDQTIADVWVEVTLDSLMEYTGSSIPGTLLSGNTFSFSAGDLAAGQSGGFTIQFNLSCDALPGETHCSVAHIYPDTLCPQNPQWSGANIIVEGHCENDSVHLLIRNAGTGNMSEPLEFIVVEDVIMYMEGSFELAAGQVQELPAIASSGQTWYLQAEQEPAHPFPGIVATAVEGCNGFNSPGGVNLFPIQNPNPFIAVDCRENIGSFDPNDKSATPVGLGHEHFIERNTDLEYLIRFQNTGTDTAFTVVILDTLSAHLDPASIRPGAGSHPFSFELLDGQTVRFTFANILLPDSATHEQASHGFVEFVAKQRPGLPAGTVIENTAAIYFDYNAPVITNRVFHTIGENFIEVINDAAESPDVHGQPLVYPNPAHGAVTFSLPADLPPHSRFSLYNLSGSRVWQAPVSGNHFVFERNGFPSGSYVFAFESDHKKWWTGKMVLK